MPSPSFVSKAYEHLEVWAVLFHNTNASGNDLRNYQPMVGTHCYSLKFGNIVRFSQTVCVTSSRFA